jgi:hypothetical protein
MITLKILVWFAFIVGHAWHDYKQINDENERPNYLLSFTVRGFIAILHAILFDPHNFFDWLPVLIFQVTSFYLFFPILLNSFRKKEIFYVGQNSGWLDSYFYKHREAQLIFIAGVLSVFILSVIVIYQR